MPGYISEFSYYGDSSSEFVEVALPVGTDPSGYSLVLYDGQGDTIQTFDLGGQTNTMSGHDVYVLDSSTPAFNTSDETGNFYPETAVALVDGDGNVVQFLSYWDNTVTANDGPAAGMTSTDVGQSDLGESMQSDDGGQTYYAQSDTNSGTIPACYAPDTLISTPLGDRPIQSLKIGDVILRADNAPALVRWVWSGTQALENLDRHQRPVLISKGALGKNRPKKDLIVSGQHRVAVGMQGQLEAHFQTPQLVHAKSLVSLRGIRFMRGKSQITWHHILCDTHCLLLANGAASETLLLGTQILRSMSTGQKKSLVRTLGLARWQGLKQAMPLPCPNVGDTMRMLAKHFRASRITHS